MEGSSRYFLRFWVERFSIYNDGGPKRVVGGIWSASGSSLIDDD